MNVYTDLSTCGPNLTLTGVDFVTKPAEKVKFFDNLEESGASKVENEQSRPYNTENSSGTAPDLPADIGFALSARQRKKKDGNGQKQDRYISRPHS